MRVADTDSINHWRGSALILLCKPVVIVLFSLSDGPLPSTMQEVDLPIINNTMCESMYRDAGYVEHIPEIFICAGYAVGGKDSCEVRNVHSVPIAHLTLVGCGSGLT